jgi:hypothetical protein
MSRISHLQGGEQALIIKDVDLVTYETVFLKSELGVTEKSAD